MESGLPFFSIILPTYNRAHLLSGAIDSVVAQTYLQWELIVVDDGSKDNTCQIVGAYTDERVKYVYQDNAERSAARNNGIKNATGNYCCFLDSDDSFLPQHLQLLANYLTGANLPAALIFIDELDKLPNGDLQPFATPKFDPANAPVFFICNTIVPGRVCIARTILNDYVFDTEINYSEDADLWLRISTTYPCHHLAVATFVYHQHDSNSVNVAKYNAFYYRLQSLKRIFKKDEAKAIPQAVQHKVLSDNYFGIIKHYEATGKGFMAWKTAFEAIFKYPQIRLKEKLYLLLKHTPGVNALLKK